MYPNLTPGIKEMETLHILYATTLSVQVEHLDFNLLESSEGPGARPQLPGWLLLSSSQTWNNKEPADNITAAQ